MLSIRRSRAFRSWTFHSRCWCLTPFRAFDIDVGLLLRSRLEPSGLSLDHVLYIIFLELVIPSQPVFQPPHPQRCVITLLTDITKLHV